MASWASEDMSASNCPRVALLDWSLGCGCSPVPELLVVVVVELLVVFAALAVSAMAWLRS